MDALIVRMKRMCVDGIPELLVCIAAGCSPRTNRNIFDSNSLNVSETPNPSLPALILNVTFSGGKNPILTGDTKAWPVGLTFVYKMFVNV